MSRALMPNRTQAVQVVKMFEEGMSAKEISKTMKIEEKGIKRYAPKKKT